MTLHFLLNDREQGADLPPHLPVLDYLREHRHLTAAKPGCREGDCGACSVLLGEADGAGGVRYRSVNACLLPLGAVAGRHLVTLEGLNDAAGPDAGLGPVQRALVDQGGIQCGFCTPGFVIALTAHLLASPRLDRDGLHLALDGNLCRCTGYQGIRRAGEVLHRLLADRLTDLAGAPAARIQPLIAAGALPGWFADAPERLARLPHPIPAEEPPAGATVLGGGTDLLIQRPALLAAHEPWFALERPELHGIRLQSGQVTIGATTRMEELLESTELGAALPALREALGHIASTPVRDRATVGGNLVNASPIGDLSILLLALDAELELHLHHHSRRLPLDRFFLGYKHLDLQAGEIVAAVRFDLPLAPAGLHFEKVAHRDHLDIASVNSVMVLELDGRRVVRIRLSAGGVGPIPRRIPDVEALLVGCELTPKRAAEAARLAASEARPIDDIRGSARYKRLLLRQQVIGHLLALAPFLDPASMLEALA